MDTIIQRLKSNKLGDAYRKAYVLKLFKECNEFLDMVKKSGISILTMSFKINLYNILDKFPRLRKSSLSLHIFKDYVKSIKKIERRVVNNLNRNIDIFTGGRDLKQHFLFKQVF